MWFAGSVRWLEALSRAAVPRGSPLAGFWGLWFGEDGSGFAARGCSRVWGLGFRGWGLWVGILAFGVQGLGFRVLGLGFRVQG